MPYCFLAHTQFSLEYVLENGGGPLCKISKIYNL
jgi:hypothetical protein